MRIKKKFITIFGFALFLIAFIIGSVSAFFLYKEYALLEKDQIQKHINTTYEVYLASLNSLDTVTKDWSNWEDLYVFANGANPTFVEEYVTPLQLKNLEVSWIMILDENKTPLINATLDNQETSLVHFPHSACVLKQIENTTHQLGVATCDKQPLAFSQKQILHNDGSGPPAGTIVFGFYYDSLQGSRFQRILKHQVQFSQEKQQNEDAAPLISSTDVYAANIHQGKNESTVYIHIFDEKKNHALTITLRVYRDIFLQGNRNVTVFFIILFCITCLSFLTVILCSEWYFSRILHQLQELQTVAEEIINKEYDTKITRVSNDEIGSLATSFDNLRERLKEQQKTIEEAQFLLEEKVKKRTQELEEKNQLLERFNKTMVNRELRMSELKNEIDALKKQARPSGKQP